MPIITLSLSPNGPILTAQIGVSFPWRTALAASGQDVPVHREGLFVVDTGASNSSVDHTFLEPLALQPTGSLMTHTSSTSGMPIPYSTYDVSLTVPGMQPGDHPLTIGTMSVTCAHYQAHGINGLIGRDVLSRCLLTYNGPSNSFSLAY